MSWEMETIVNATVSVDTFFLMSGLLVSYLLLRELMAAKENSMLRSFIFTDT